MNELFSNVDASILAAEDHVSRLQRLQPLSPAQQSIVQGLINSLANVKAATTRVKNEHCKMETQWASSGSELT
jgi:hypothetical protein